MKKIITLDSQMLSMFQECPFKYYLSHIKHIEPKGKKTALSIGSIFHELFYSVNQSILDEPDKELGLRILDAFKSVDWTEVTATEKTFILKRFAEYFEHWKVDSTCYKLVAAEKGFSKVIYDSMDYQYVYEGRIDALYYHLKEKVFVWRDYKTNSGRKIYQHNNQFYGYTWAFQEEGSRGEIDYIGKQKEKNEKTFEREIISFHKDQVARWVERTIQTFHKVREKLYGEPFEEYPQNLTSCSGLYGLCGFHKICERDPMVHAEIIKFNYQEKEEKWKAW